MSATSSASGCGRCPTPPALDPAAEEPKEIAAARKTAEKLEAQRAQEAEQAKEAAQPSQQAHEEEEGDGVTLAATAAIGPPRLPLPDRRRDRLRPRRPRHPRRGPRHRHHQAAGARRPLAGRRARRPRRRVPPAHRRVHRLGAGPDLRRFRRRPPSLRADAHQGPHRPLPGRRLRQPLGRPRRGRRRRGRPRLGRRRRLPHHLDRPGRTGPRAPPRSTGAFLFRHWVLPFEALSVLLLAALVGAIVLSRRTPGTYRHAERPGGER